MKVKELIEYLQKQDKEREVVLHIWNGEESLFSPIIPAATPLANTKNLLVFIEQKECVEPIR